MSAIFFLFFYYIFPLHPYNKTVSGCVCQGNQKTKGYENRIDDSALCGGCA